MSIEAEAQTLEDKIRDRLARISILGLGYAGLPIAIEMARARFPVLGLDVDSIKVDQINLGQSPVTDVSSADVAQVVDNGSLVASADFALLAEQDCAVICVPTPLTPERRPDLSYLATATRTVAAHLHPGMLVILQSTCPPGTLRKVMLPLLEETGLRGGIDFHLAFAPERIDPGNEQFTVTNTPKLVGGLTPRCTEVAATLLRMVVEQVVEVSSPEVAEMSKVLENTFRFINISFVNEMAMLCNRMGIDVWQVVKAASTKPFAFMPHYPGPGVGGHCIPVVPFYLEASAAEYGMAAELVEVAGRINDAMPRYVVDRAHAALAECGKDLGDAKVLVLGVAYKADVADVRESPALPLIKMLQAAHARVAYHDEYVPELDVGGFRFSSQPLEPAKLGEFDCVVLTVAHSYLDLPAIVANAKLVLDTRNSLGSFQASNIVRL